MSLPGLTTEWLHCGESAYRLSAVLRVEIDAPNLVTVFLDGGSATPPNSDPKEVRDRLMTVQWIELLDPAAPNTRYTYIKGDAVVAVTAANLGNQPVLYVFGKGGTRLGYTPVPSLSATKLTNLLSVVSPKP